MSEPVWCSNCGEPAKYRGKKLCAKCYQRFRAHGDFDLHTGKIDECAYDGCELPVKAYGWCDTHWRRIQTHGTPSDQKWSHRGSDRCAVPGCGGRHRSMGLCDRHYSAEQKRGHPLWRTPARRKVHGDRPWSPDTVRDFERLAAHDLAARPTLLSVPMSDPEVKRAYVRSYQRATAALRDQYPVEFNRLLEVERAKALGEDNVTLLMPGPAKGTHAVSRRPDPSVPAPHLVEGLAATDEAEDLIVVLSEALRARLRVDPNRLVRVGALLRRLTASYRDHVGNEGTG